MFFLVEEELYFRFQITEVRLKNGLQSYDFLEKVAFNCLSILVNRPERNGEDDEGSPVDDVDEEIGEEIDVECDGEED